MTNLLDETLGYMINFGLNSSRVVYVGSHDGLYRTDWEGFEHIAKNLVYNSGFGAQEIAEDLVVAFDDGSYFAREEYDGAESWVYIAPPGEFPKSHDLKVVNGGMWDSVGDLHARVIDRGFSG